MTERAKAAEILRQREHGRGKPIITGEFAGKRIIAVPGGVLYGNYKAFPDMLFHHIKTVLGLEWGGAELAKPLAERHPIMQWLESVGRLWKTTTAGTHDVVSAPITGAVQMYLGQSYNLFLLRHDAEIVADLVTRLKSRDHYMGAFYESFVEACFIRAGFKLELEDERNNLSDHHEFIATHPSGRKYAVEAKSRQPGKTEPKVVSKLKDALGKKTDLPRIVCVDVNIASKPGESPELWMQKVFEDVKAEEGTMYVSGRKAPSAYLIVTNHPYHYDLESTNTVRAILPIGFKIPDFGHNAAFPSLTEWYKATKVKHGDVEELIESMTNYTIPSTFDGSIPEFTYGTAEQEWIIGKSYDLSSFEPGASGVLTTAIVTVVERMAHLGFHLTDGRAILGRMPLSDAELAAYERSPDTFFGVHLKVGKTITSPFEWFEFFVDSMKGVARDKMLKFFEKSPNLERLKQLNDEDLFYYYCERHTLAMTLKKVPQSPPEPTPPPA